MVPAEFLLVKLVVYHRLIQKRHIKKHAGIIGHQHGAIGQQPLHIVGGLVRQNHPLRARLEQRHIPLHLHMRVKYQPVVVLLQQLRQFIRQQQRLVRPTKRRIRKRLAGRVMRAAPCRHQQNHPLAVIVAHQIIEPAKAHILHHLRRMAEGIPHILVLRFGAAHKHIQIQIFAVQPFHLVLGDAVLQKHLFSARFDAVRCQMVKNHQIRCRRLHMGTDQVISAVIQQIMHKAAEIHRPAQRIDLVAIHAVRRNDIAGIHFRVLFF